MYDLQGILSSFGFRLVCLPTKNFFADSDSALRVDQSGLYPISPAFNYSRFLRTVHVKVDIASCLLHANWEIIIIIIYSKFYCEYTAEVIQQTRGAFSFGDEKYNSLVCRRIR